MGKENKDQLTEALKSLAQCGMFACLIILILSYFQTGHA